jgi:MraZ protein
VEYGGGKWSKSDQPGSKEVGDVFLGTHTPKLDEKGRFFLPAKFRDELADGLVITRGQDRCLAIWPVAAFVEQTQTLRNSPSSNKQVRDYQRMLASGASDETPDKQGRITIPPHLRTYAGLDKDCVVVGAINRVEVWDSTAWEHYAGEQESAFAEMNDDGFPGL